MTVSSIRKQYKVNISNKVIIKVNSEIFFPHNSQFISSELVDIKYTSPQNCDINTIVSYNVQIGRYFLKIYNFMM